MINDAGKHNVKTAAFAVTLSACEDDAASAAVLFAPHQGEGEGRMHGAQHRMDARLP
jgi:hypothetical protein